MGGLAVPSKARATARTFKLGEIPNLNLLAIKYRDVLRKNLSVAAHWRLLLSSNTGCISDSDENVTIFFNHAPALTA
jgi:hypothetical protein